MSQAPQNMQDAAFGAEASGTAVPSSVTCADAPRAKVLGRRMHPARLEAAVIVARIVNAAVADTTSTRALGAALDVQHVQVVKWSAAEAPVAFALRDLVAAYFRGEKAFAVRVLDRVRAFLTDPEDEPAPPSRAACAISHAAGTVCGVARRIEEDGRIDDQEAAEFLDALRAAEAVIVHARKAREVKGR